MAVLSTTLWPQLNHRALPALTTTNVYLPYCRAGSRTWYTLFLSDAAMS